MFDGFLRVSCATPDIKVADCTYNSNNIINLAKEAACNGASVILFPELCVTGYTCGDLFLQTRLINSAKDALENITLKTAGLDAVIVVGVPIKSGSALYNCAAVLYKGKILGFVPKKNIPNYGEFYEVRHFTAGSGRKLVKIGNEDIVMSPDVLFSCKSMPEFKLGVEICEDLWTAEPPSGKLALSGATIIANPSASDEVIGKAEYRRLLVKSQSARTLTAYMYCSSGLGESTTDMIFSGHNLIAENGSILAESKRFKNSIIYCDVDLQRLEGERVRSNTYCGEQAAEIIEFDMPLRQLEQLNRTIEKMPFVPHSSDLLDDRCEEILTMQATGLATRLRHTGAKTAVVGLSGGLDSTLALIVTVHAFDMLLLDRKNIIAVTMPCFGTTKRTKNNAEILSEVYGVSLRDVSVKDAVNQHFKDIGQNPETLDVTYENCQARERTQVLMDIANMTGGLVIGTGDLSELALGWATYNGDHMSMYAVNASIPKTLVRYITAFEAKKSGGRTEEVLKSILDTPVSPELLPPKDGEISQKTEELVGPYELHDFYLYYFVRLGFTPKKILRLAKLAFAGEYDDETIEKWLKIFIRRFFSQQFKRSCLPDGPKVGTVTLSPRSDWRMPSDASSSEWSL